MKKWHMYKQHQRLTTLPSHNLNPPRCRRRLKMRVSQIKVVSDGLECSDALESIQVDTGEMSLAMDPGAPWVSVTVRILF